MAENSKIQWTTHTYNPWRGCTKVHAGCTNCYAEALSGRNPATLGVWGPNGTRVVAAERSWEMPLKWDRAAAKAGERHRVFCASLADVFEDWKGPISDHVGDWLWWNDQGIKFTQPAGRNVAFSRRWTLDDVRSRLFSLIDATPNLDWMLLTKRPENVRRMWPVWSINQSLYEKTIENVRDDVRADLARQWHYRRNVWLGTSISDQSTMEKWLPELAMLDDLAPVRFLSAEPLIGPIDFAMKANGTGSALKEGKINLVIVGGESGHGARPCNVEWIRSIVKQCAEAGVACFVKQLGAAPVRDGALRGNDAHMGPGSHREQTPIVLEDKKGGDWNEWPNDLRVRQMPATEAAK